MENIGIFFLGFVTTLAIVCIADAIIESSMALK